MRDKGRSSGKDGREEEELEVWVAQGLLERVEGTRRKPEDQGARGPEATAESQAAWGGDNVNQEENIHMDDKET